MTRAFAYTTMGHHYIFAWQAGREPEVMRRFAAMAVKAEWPFSWHDAATCTAIVREQSKKHKNERIK